MDDALRGKVAIVTGGGQGVGRGIALALASRGAAVAITGRRRELIESTLADIEARGVRGLAVVADNNDPQAISQAVEQVVDAFGRVDILVNNAQQVPLGPLLSVSDEAFTAGFTSGPLASMRYMKACHPHMKAAGGGVIFNMASSAGVRWDMANYGAYGAVKQAIRSLTRAGASEWGVDGIRVLTIAPHADSPGLKGWIEKNPEEAAAFFQTIPLRRVGRCEEDIGNAVAALCGTDLAYLTGATIPLDGGQANFD